MPSLIHRQVGCGKHLSSSIPSNKIIRDKYGPMLGKYLVWGLSGPTSMTTLVLFWTNSCSSQLLDLM
jgi:hypothetical protein